MRQTLAAFLVLLAPSTALAATYQVGPTRTYKALADVIAGLKPGDVVELDAGTYSGAYITRSGTAAAPITLRGVGGRPKIQGGDNTLHVAADYWVVENVELTGGVARCYFHHGHGHVLRNVVVHDCPAHGILGADNDSGSLTVEYSDVYRNGQGDGKHQIYASSDEVKWPGAVFRLQHTWIHDGTGGIGLKSRAGRNEVYYNWFEGNLYYDLDLVGSQEYDPGVVREDSDVVGNMFVRTNDQSAARFGGDGTGESFGRVRMAWNTFVTQQVQWGSPVIRLRDGLESLDTQNNAFFSATAVPPDIFRDVDVAWVAGRQQRGAGNWTPTGATMVPVEWTGGVSGAAPGWDAGYVPLAGSGLVGKAVALAGLPRPAYSPTRGRVTTPRARATATTIGAYEGTSGATSSSAASTGAGTPPVDSVEDPSTPYAWPIAGGAVMTLAGFLTWLATRARIKR